MSTSSEDSRASFKAQPGLSRFLADVVLSPTPDPKASQITNGSNNLDPVKYSPPSPGYLARVPVMANTHISYSSVADMNPFDDERYTRISDFLPSGSADARSASTAQPTFRHKGMSQSLSEGYIDFRKAYPKQSVKLPPSRIDDHRGRYSEDDGPVHTSSPSRGRALSRTPSPLKDLSIIKEDPSPEVSPTRSSDEYLQTPVKRSRSPVKQLFGEHGWLGKTPGSKDTNNEEARKNGFKHWGDKLRQRVDHLTEDIPKFDVAKFMPSTIQIGQSPPKSKSPVQSRFYVTLTPPQQAKLYSEMELMICATANTYLQVQQSEGRMSIESLKKVLETWQAKNRPQVIEFMFDQQTQREFIVANMKSFRFFGPNGNNIISVNTMLHAWKSLAKELAVRTFCAPDVAVKKNMSDCSKVLTVLGAPKVILSAFNNIRLTTEWTIERGQRYRDEYENVDYGVERDWEPSQSTKKVEENPFV